MRKKPTAALEALALKRTKATQAVYSRLPLQPLYTGQNKLMTELGPKLLRIEELTREDSTVNLKDRQLLLNIMEFIETKGFASRAQLFNIHRILNNHPV